MQKRRRSDKTGAIQIFAGLLKCMDCGYSLSYRNSKSGGSYNCSLNHVKGKGYCRSHFITHNDLYEIVLDDIRRKAHIAVDFEDYLLEQLKRQATGIYKSKQQSCEKEAKMLAERIEELDAIISKLYEDSVLGRITLERFQNLLDKYETEQKSHKEKLQTLQDALCDQQKHKSVTERFIQLIRQYADLKELNAAILNELIDKIEVGHKQVIDGVKTQSIRILYKQIGYIEFDVGLFNIDKAM